MASVIATNSASKKMCGEDEVEDPKASPMVWVSKWVDYSDKYGFGYALCDESIGKFFTLFSVLYTRWRLKNVKKSNFRFEKIVKVCLQHLAKLLSF